MRKYIAFIVSLLVGVSASFALAASAGAAGETAATSFTITPNKGPLYQGGLVPASWSLQTQIRKDYDEGEELSKHVLPLQNVNVKLPGDMTFRPNPKMATCPDSKVGPDANLSVPPPTVYARCPDALIGNGHADLYLAKQNLPEVPPPGGVSPQWIDDATLLAFNGGLKAGRPHLKIYGYSFKTNYGVYIDAVLQEDGVLDVNVPWLSQDSAVANFDLNLPGKQYKFTNAFDKVVTIQGGKDPNYVRARCSTGDWTLTSDFTLQQRDNNTKESHGERLTIYAPDAHTSCVGKPGKPPAGGGGKARFSNVAVKGPRAVRRGGVATFVVRVKNLGNAPARGVVVRGNGRGVRGGLAARMGALRPGKIGAVRLRARAVGRRGSVALARFVVNGKGVRAKASRVSRFRIR